MPLPEIDTIRYIGSIAPCALAWAVMATRRPGGPREAVLAASALAAMVALAACALAPDAAVLPALAIAVTIAACCMAAVASAAKSSAGAWSRRALRAALAPGAVAALAMATSPATGLVLAPGPESGPLYVPVSAAAPLYLAWAAVMAARPCAGPARAGRAAALAGAAALAAVQALDWGAPWGCWALLAASAAARPPEPDRSGKRDALTGLPNRAALDEHLEERMADATGELCLVLLDADRFKPINDGFGHNEGDRALTLIAEGMRRAAAQDRPDAFLCRYAGDEFVMCVDSADVEEVREFANVTRSKVADAAWEDGRPYRLTVTAGIARWDPSSGMDAAALVAAADRDMYGRKPARR